MLGLLVVTLLVLVVIPALLYLIGWGARRAMRKTPAWIGLPAPGETPVRDR